MDIKTVNKILKLIRDKKINNESLLIKLKQYHESDIADAFESLNEDEKKALFSKLPLDFFGEILTYVENPEYYLEQLEPEKAADIVETMDADDAVDILEEVDEEVAQDILDEMEDEQREDIELINNFDDDEIGSKITTNYICINKNASIKEAMKELVSQAPENDNIQNLFVIEEDGEYYGTIILKDLIIAREGTNLLDITKTEYPTLYAHEKVEDVLTEIKEIDLDIIPVLAENNTILGVITSQDIIETVDEEMDEDYLKFAAVDEEVDEDDNIFKAAKRRFPWLSMLLLIGTFSSAILSGFDTIIAIVPALVFFQSWILDASGNAGTQSLALCIRSISNDKLDNKTFGRYFLREILIGLLDGLIVGVVGFAISFLFLIITKEAGNIQSQLTISFVVGFALFSAIPITTILGLIIPVLFEKIHIDPAVASGPLITTLSDMGGIAIYYSVASLLLNLFNLL